MTFIFSIFSTLPFHYIYAIKKEKIIERICKRPDVLVKTKKMKNRKSKGSNCIMIDSKAGNTAL